MMIMAAAGNLPYLTSLKDCGSYLHTIKPFLTSQLVHLPRAWLSPLTDTSSEHTQLLSRFLRIYLSTNPFVSTIYFSLIAAGIFFVVSTANRNYSQVDRMWSILPAAYVAHYAVWARLAGEPSARNEVAAAIIALWSARLTFNYWRKGGYSIGSEDYRWVIIKRQIGEPMMVVFNATFISVIQSVLLALIASPAYILMLVSRIQPQLSLKDVISGSVILGCLAIEFIADNQQCAYQSAKKEYQTRRMPENCQFSKAELDRGFITTGLWSRSRHPNFACEQLIWIMVYQWAAVTSKAYLNWSIVGALGLVSVFFGSTILTEAISARKYPHYALYQRLVSKFKPFSLGIEDKLGLQQKYKMLGWEKKITQMVQARYAEDKEE